MIRAPRYRPFILLAAALVLAAAASCDRTPTPESIIDHRTKAIKNGDASAIAADLADAMNYPLSQSLSEPERWKRLFDQWGTPDLLEKASMTSASEKTTSVRRELRMQFKKGDRTLLYEGPETLWFEADGSGAMKINRVDLPLFEINQTLEVRRRAMTGRDLTLYLSTVADQFSSPGKDRQALESKMNHLFTFWDGISIEIMDREISVKEDSATAIQRFRMTATKDGKSQTFENPERILLVREQPGAWKISGGL